jgi:hypothetical protein
MMGQIESAPLLLGYVAVPHKLLLAVSLPYIVSSENGEQLIISHVVNGHPLACPVKVFFQSSVGVVLEVTGSEDVACVEDVVGLSEGLVVFALGLVPSRQLSVHKALLLISVGTHL